MNAHEPSRTLYVGAGLAAVGGVNATHRGLLTEGETIVWTGDPVSAPAADQTIDLGSAWFTPGFVDAHVHATATGLLIQGVDLGGVASVAELLAVIRTAALTSGDRVLFGAGWDDRGWPEGRPPHAQELAAAAPGKTVILIRVDGHSCVVDQDTLGQVDLRAVGDHVHRDSQGDPTGWLVEAASAVALATVRTQLTPTQLQAARDATCAQALRLGITSIHEMGIPALSERDDALAWANGDWPIAVHAYWASMEIDSDAALRPGGDLFLDGSIGSCTAATSRPYRTNDGTTTTGTLFHSDEEVAEFFITATRHNRGAGVHAIGDRAVQQAVDALDRAAQVCGVTAVRLSRHRIEHVELISPAQVRTMARLGVTASVQPAFDALWNGPGSLYEHRFGPQIAVDTNPLAWFRDAGVTMCFSSDSTVTPMDPWGGIAAAQSHRGGHNVDRRTALEAATIGGHHAVADDDNVGALVPGHRADLVAWPGDPVQHDPTGWSPVLVLTGGRRHGL